MRFDSPAGINPIDRQTVVGRPVDRIDGPLKVSGRAPYTHDRHDAAPDQAYGYIVVSPIAKGRIVRIDTSLAQVMPGVLSVVTAESAGPLGKGTFNNAPLLAGPEIQHYHQAVAVVVAESFEEARAAAGVVAVDYVAADGTYDLAEAKADAFTPGQIPGGEPPTTRRGDFETAFAAAPIQLEEIYTTPDETHAMLEPHASIAAWEGENVTLWNSNQMVDWARGDLAKTLGIPKDNVRVISSYVGGGFGAKTSLRADGLLAALGARVVGRPVRIALPRTVLINNTQHRGATIQRVRIGADHSGKIRAIAHEAWSGDLNGVRAEAGGVPTRLLYAGEHRFTATYLSRLDLPECGPMRAPGESSGLMASEIAIDEMAEKCGLDPVAFRILNDATENPEHPERPFSSRRLADCFRVGAERFGWDQRVSCPARIRDGQWLVGMGTAAAIRNNILRPSAARVRLDRNGVVTVETDMTDIGTGSYTIIGQTAAEMMGVGLDRVIVRLGDSTFPVSSGSAGQFGANSSTAGVYAACAKLREMAAARLGFNSADAVFEDGLVRSGGLALPLGRAALDEELVAEDMIDYAHVDKSFQQTTLGAHFVEVGVDTSSCEIRVRRMLAVCSAGRILNPKTARSQVIGGMTMGVGAALMEELVVDKRAGFFLNLDLASYEVPVNADIPHQDVIFLDEVDPLSSPMKAKGVGELGICGVAAALANAVYNATGVRIRHYPITLDKLLAQPVPA